MSEVRDNNPVVIGLLAAIVVLLAVVVGMIVWPSQNGDSTSESTAQDTDLPIGSAVIIDPTTATRIPDDMTPEEFAAQYYEAILAGDYETAFYMQPADRQGGSSVADFQTQLEGYDIVGYEVTGVTQQGDVYQVIVDQQTGSFGTFVNEWQFQAYEDGWLVASKSVAGMK